MGALYRCKARRESGIIGVLANNNQGDDLKLNAHQFEIALTRMPRLSGKMREAMRRVAVDGESQTAVADSLPGIKQQHLSKNLATFREKYLAKLDQNGFFVREVIIPKGLEDAVDDFELHATQHLLKKQRIRRQSETTKIGPSTKPKSHS